MFDTMKCLWYLPIHSWTIIDRKKNRYLPHGQVETLQQKIHAKLEKYTVCRRSQTSGYGNLLFESSRMTLRLSCLSKASRIVLQQWWKRQLCRHCLTSYIGELSTPQELSCLSVVGKPFSFIFFFRSGSFKSYQSWEGGQHGKEGEKTLGPQQNNGRHARITASGRR